MLAKNKIIQNISELKSLSGKWRGKFLRNLRLYCYSMGVNLDQIKEGNVVGYWHLINSDYTSTISENVIQSAIDALTSQLAAKNAIPFFDTVNGTFAQQQIMKLVEQYFSMAYDEQNVTATVTDAFRDACIFGTGFVYIDQNTKLIKKALPWQVMYRPSEDTYGKPTRVYYERKSYPTSMLPFKYKDNVEYVTFGEYYDTVNNVKAYVIDDVIYKVEEYLPGVIPIIPIHYVNPVVGKDTTSVVDILYGIQMKLQDLFDTYSEAIRRNPAQTFIVPQGSDVKVTALSNRVGQYITYKPIEGVNNPVASLTPDFISEQYNQAIATLKQDAYELVGISRLSAQSVKPSGVDSGRAMKTLNDIESERFEVQFKAVIRLYNEIARVCIKIFNPEDYVLPEDRNRLMVKWGDVQAIYDKAKISFSSIDFLSKDPTQRAQEIDMLIQRGAIPQSRAGLFYEMPDSEAAYSYANNSINAVMTVINQAIVNEDYTIPAYIPLDMLMSEITNTLLSLKSTENETNKADIERLEILYSEAVKMKQAIDGLANKQATQADNASFALNLQRQTETLYQTTFAQTKAQLDAQVAVNTNNINQ